MASGSSQSDKILAKAKGLFTTINITQVQCASWDALREANNTLALGGLNVCTDHITAEVFKQLSLAVKTGDRKFPKQFWEWMVQPVRTGGRQASLPRAKALMVMLAQAIGQSSGEVAAAASVAYLSLLEAKGAGPLWSILTQPAVVFYLLKLLNPLCTYLRRRAKTAATISEATEGDPDDPEQLPAADEAVDEEALCICTAVQAQEILAALVAFLRSHSLSGAQGVRGMVIEKLTTLALHPAEDGIAQEAVAGLSAIVANTDGSEEVRGVAVTIMRSVLPAVIMTQDLKYLNQSSVPKQLQSSRAAVLKLLSEMACSHPELMTSRKHAQRAEDGGMLMSLDSREEEQESAAAGLDAPLLAMLQLICVKAPEKAEWRMAAAESVVHLLRTSTPAEPGRVEHVEFQRHALDFIDQLLHCDRPAWRTMAVDITTMLSEHSKQLLRGATKEAWIHFETRLLRALIERCMDSMATVRGRAVGGVTSLVSRLVQDPVGMKVCREVLGDITLPRSAGAVETSDLDIGAIFARTARDETSKVRRVALSLFDAVLPAICAPNQRSIETLQSHFELELLGRLANDESVMVRKAAISSISLLLRTCPMEITALLWVAHVLPMIFDAENSVAERAFADIDLVVLEPLSQENGMDGEVLSLVSRALERDSDSMKYIRQALQSHAKRGKGTSVAVLMSSVLEETRQCLKRPISEWRLLSWIVLAEVAAVGAAKKSSSAPIIALKAWERFDNNGGSTDLEGSKMGKQILRVLEHLAPSLPAALAIALRDSFFERLVSLNLSVEGSRSALYLIGKIEAVRTKNSGAWRLPLLRTLDAKLTSFMQDFEQSGRSQSESICRCLFTLGQLALSDPASAEAISQRTVLDIKAIASRGVQCEGTPTAADIAMRSHAFGALGKLCLKRDDLAKRLVELFVLHLNDGEAVTVRSNCLIVLSDLCERYTSLVDRFVVNMAELLKDGNAFLRKQAVLVLSSLLSENFITFRGPIVYRFLYVLGDPVDSVRNLAESITTRVLHPQNAGVFSSIFLDVVCVLNNWAGHPCFQGAAGNSAFALLQFPERRSMIYSFLLSLMSNEQKLSVYSQLVTNFLAAFIDAEAPVKLPKAREDAGGQALHDVLSLLMSKELRASFTPRRAGEGDDAEHDQEIPGTQPMEMTTRNALKSMLKTIMCEHVMPVLIPLKNLMETHHSPFLGELRHCMCVMVREFKEELRDIMAADPQLAKELLFDLGRQEQVQRVSLVPPQADEGDGDARHDASATSRRKRARSRSAGTRGGIEDVESCAKTPRGRARKLCRLPTPQRQTRAGRRDEREHPADASAQQDVEGGGGGGGLLGLLMRSRERMESM